MNKYVFSLHMLRFELLCYINVCVALQGKMIASRGKGSATSSVLVEEQPMQFMPIPMVSTETCRKSHGSGPAVIK